MSWKASLHSANAEAEALPDDGTPHTSLDGPSLLMTSEAGPSELDRWRLAWSLTGLSAFHKDVAF